jgi:hypothetical protein
MSIRDKFQETFHIKVLRVHGSEANRAPNSELGKVEHQSEDIGLGPNREETKGNWTGKTHRTGNYIKCVQCAELLKPDATTQVYFELIAQLLSMLPANRSHL